MNKLLYFLDGPRTFPKPIGHIEVVGKWHLACMTWLPTKTKPRVEATRFISLSYDEMKTSDKQS
jgi:hypothetical protein